MINYSISPAILNSLNSFSASLGAAVVF